MEKINVNWTEKADLVDDILAEDFNNAFKSIQDGFDNTKKEIDDNKDEMKGIANNAEANADKLNSLKYYGDMNIVPSDASLFTFATDDETMTASVSAKSTTISGDIVIPYNYTSGDKTYSVTSIVREAFNNCDKITSITIPNSVTSIEKSAFAYCDGITSITIPNSVTSIKLYAFFLCSVLTDIYFKGSKAEWDSIEIGVRNEPLETATIHYNWVPAMKNYVDEKVGDIDTALDNIIAIQNTLRGGETV